MARNAPRLVDRRDEAELDRPDVLAWMRAIEARVAVLERARRAIDAGRAAGIKAARERGTHSVAMVRDLLIVDLHDGRPERGRAGRIARKLGGALSESQVQRILRALYGVRDSAALNGVVESEGERPCKS